MKKNLMIVIMVLLVFSFPMHLSAEEDQKKGSVEKEKIELNEEQKIIFKLDNSLENVDFDNSFVTLVNDDNEERIIYKLSNIDNIVSISFVINEGYGVGETWHTKGLTLAFFDARSNYEIAYESSFEIVGNDPLKDNTLNDEKIVENQEVSNESTTSYTVANYISDIQCIPTSGKIEITANITNEIKKVAFPTWTSNNGQDDMTWEIGSINANRIVYTIDMKEHNYETGTYFTHIYLYGENDNVLDIVPLENEMIYNKPIVTNVKAIEGNGFYDITANVSGYGNTSTEVATWSDANGQDDLVWGNAEVENGVLFYRVEAKEHNYETGLFHTHIYTSDDNGETILTPIDSIITVSPINIKDVNVVNNNGQFTITAKVEGYDIQSAQFPTWSDANGQDDLIWGIGSINGDTISYTVEAKDHKYEAGLYHTHIYVYDGKGAVMVVPVDTEMIINNNEVKDINVVNNNGRFTITAKVEGYDIQSVQFPTWSDANGQDDLIWGIGSINGDTISYTVEAKDHKYEAGLYHTHIYIYDGKGALTVVPVDTEMIINNNKIKDVNVVNNNGQYTITAKVEGYDIQSVQFPTWSDANGQDDLIWGIGSIKGNIISYTVEAKDHKYETGLYHTHIYVYDGAGNVLVIPIDSEMNIAPPKINDVTVQNSEGRYKIRAKVEGYNIKAVQFPTWTSKNGQDDIYWGTGSITGNDINYTVDIKDHGFETGLYHTHIYVYDGAGNTTVMPVDVVLENRPPVIKDVIIKDINTYGYTIICTVEDGYGLDKVVFPTWTSKDGQDDIKWNQGNINGNTVTYRVSIKDHGFQFGEYLTHIYAYDLGGTTTTWAVQPVIIGRMSSGFNTFDGNTYYVNGDGTLAKGFVSIGSDVYYFNQETSIMTKGNVYIDRRRFYFNETTGKFSRMTADIPYYNQRDARWGNKAYGRWQFSGTGCVPTGAAMVFSFLNNTTILPNQMGDWAYAKGYFNNSFAGCTDSLWMDYSWVSGRYCRGNLNINDAVYEMKRGRILTALMDPGIFSPIGTTHQIVIYGIDENNMVDVYDPYYPENNGRYHISTIFAQKSTSRIDSTNGGPILAIG